MAGSEPGPGPQVMAGTDGTRLADPVTDLADYTLPPGSPGAQMLAGPRAAALAPRPAVQVRQVMAPHPLAGVAGRLVTTRGGRMAVTASGLTATPRIAALQHPALQGIDTDPPPGVPVIQGMTDGGLVVYPLAYFGFQGDDAGSINAALLQAQGRGNVQSAPVRLAPYPFSLLSPIAFPPLTGSVLEGAVPVNEDAGGSNADLYGTVLAPQAGWQGAGLANAGVVYLAPPAGSSGVLRRPVIRNLWVDLRAAPAGTLGISAYGSVSHGLVEHVGVWGNSADTTQDNIRLDQNAGLSTSPDGWEFAGVISQSYGRNGLYLFARDTIFERCHMQGAPSTTTDNACAQLDKANNVRFIGCRFDQSVVGVVTDSNPGGVPNTPGSTLSLIDCGFENNYKSALWCNNTSSTGQQMRIPVRAMGCNFDYPGRDGASGAVLVSGYNNLKLYDCDVTMGGPGSPPNYPVVGLVTQAVGTGPGVPQLILIDGGLWNVNGANMISDPAGTAILRYRFYGVTGGNMLAGVAPSAVALVKSATWP